MVPANGLTLVLDNLHGSTTTVSVGTGRNAKEAGLIFVVAALHANATPGRMVSQDYGQAREMRWGAVGGVGGRPPGVVCLLTQDFFRRRAPSLLCRSPAPTSCSRRACTTPRSSTRRPTCPCTRRSCSRTASPPWAASRRPTPSTGSATTTRPASGRPRRGRWWRSQPGAASRRPRSATRWRCRPVRG